jgi:hypothetical protein
VASCAPDFAFAAAVVFLETGFFALATLQPFRF